jgi:hypothetical protein
MRVGTKAYLKHAVAIAGISKIFKPKVVLPLRKRLPKRLLQFGT